MAPRPAASTPSLEPVVNADSQSPLQIDYFRINMDGAPFLFDYPHTCDYAQKSLRTTSLLLLPVCVWNSSPLITKMTPAWKGHLSLTWEARKSEFSVVQLLRCIILWGRGQGHKCHFWNTVAEKLTVSYRKVSSILSTHSSLFFLLLQWKKKNNTLNVGGKKSSSPESSLLFCNISFIFFWLHPSLSLCPLLSSQKIREY